MEIENLRRRLDEVPGDDDARAELGRRLLEGGDKEGAAEAWYFAACGAHARGREDLYRQRLEACLKARPDWPLLFLEPPAPSQDPREAGARILVVHPESRVRGPLVRLLLDHGYLVEEAATVGSARAVLRDRAQDLVITAPELLDGDALAVAQATRKASKTAAVVLLTCAAKGEMTAPGDRVASLVDEHLDRPLSPGRLLEAVAAALWRQRHAAELPLRPAKRLELPPSLTGLGAIIGRTTIVVAAGYALLFALEFWLEAPPSPVPEPALRVRRTPTPAALPAEISAEAERLLWTRLTATEASSDSDFVVQVTSVTPDLVAARAWRQARRRDAGSVDPRPEVETQIAALRADQQATFEIHVSSSRRDFDALETAASVHLSLDNKVVSPIAPPSPQSLRFVRESEAEGNPRTRSLHFRVAFPRTPLEHSDVIGVVVALAGTPHVVYVARSQLGGH